MSDPNYLKEPSPFDMEELHYSHKRKIRMLVLCIAVLAVGCVCLLVYAFSQRAKVERILNASETQRYYSKESNQVSEEKIKMLEQQIAHIMHEVERQQVLAQQLHEELLTCRKK